MLNRSRSPFYSSRQQMPPQSQLLTRAWCKFCRVWVSTTRVQREQHESAAPHRAAIAARLKDIAERNDERRRVEGGVGEFAVHAVGRGTNGIRKGVSHVGGKRRGSGGARTQLLEAALTTFACDPVVAPARGKDDHVDTGFPRPVESVYGGWAAVEGDEVNGSEIYAESCDEERRADDGDSECKLDEKEVKEGQNPELDQTLNELFGKPRLRSRLQMRKKRRRAVRGRAQK